MGQVYAKTYFPSGYHEWLSKTNMDNNEEISEEIYNSCVINEHWVNTINQIATHYSELVAKADSNIDDYISYLSQEESEASMGRRIYDPLIANEICKFWLELIKQPKENIKNYYKLNKPNGIEQLFYTMESKYNLKETYPASVTIEGYKMYT